MKAHGVNVQLPYVYNPFYTSVKYAAYLRYDMQ